MNAAETRVLIAEVGEHFERPGSPNINDGQGYCGRCSYNWPCLAVRLADALEAATREPSVIDRDVAIDAIAGGTISVPGGYGVLHGDDAENIVDAIIGQATVPDAATEFLDAVNNIEAQKFDLRLERDAALARIAELETMLENYTREYPIECNKRVNAEARIAEAAKLHRPFGRSFGYGQVLLCRGCADRGAPADKAAWPCPTAVALGLNEGENE